MKRHASKRWHLGRGQKIWGNKQWWWQRDKHSGYPVITGCEDATSLRFAHLASKACPGLQGPDRLSTLPPVKSLKGRRMRQAIPACLLNEKSRSFYPGVRVLCKQLCSLRMKFSSVSTFCQSGKLTRSVYWFVLINTLTVDFLVFYVSLQSIFSNHHFHFCYCLTKTYPIIFAVLLNPNISIQHSIMHGV